MSTQPVIPGRIPEIEVRHRLRIAREASNLEQKELADVMGVSRNTVSRAELGVGAPRKIVLKAWALATGVPVSWLETGEAPSPGGDGASDLCTPRDSNPEPIDLRSVRARRMAVAA